MIIYGRSVSGNIAKSVYCRSPFIRTVSTATQSRGRYGYGLWLATDTQDPARDEEMSKKEIQDLVNSTLGVMTAGCEQCVYSQRLFCEKLRRPVKVRDSRCDFFTRRQSAYHQDLV